MPILELTQPEKETLKKDLLDFVHRVSAPNGYKSSSEERTILPLVLEWIYRYSSV